jgi:rare lipoprotein A
MKKQLIGLVVLTGLALGGCAPTLKDGFRNQPMNASWYGEPFHGRRTASGEVFNMDDLTAAHRTLPFGTRLRVRRPDTGRSVQVTINDRGPFVAGRQLDLSRAAADRLGMMTLGVARVQVDHLGRDSRYLSYVKSGAVGPKENTASPLPSLPVAPAPIPAVARLPERPLPQPAVATASPAPGHCAIQIGAFRDPATAARMAELLQRTGYPDVRVRTVQRDAVVWHRVHVGSFSAGTAAEPLAARLRSDGYPALLVPTSDS